MSRTSSVTQSVWPSCRRRTCWLADREQVRSADLSALPDLPLARWPGADGGLPCTQRRQEPAGLSFECQADVHRLVDQVQWLYLWFTLLIDQTGGSRQSQLLVLDGYRSNIIDGLILSPLSVTAADLTERGLDFPTVLLGESVDTGGLIYISIDNVAAARAATTHLLKQGRRRIADVGTMPTGR